MSTDPSTIAVPRSLKRPAFMTCLSRLHIPRRVSEHSSNAKP